MAQLEAELMVEAELMAGITALSEQAKLARAADKFADCDELLVRRQQLLEQLVNLEATLAPATHIFLTQLMTDDQHQIRQLLQAKAEMESQQVSTKRSARSINRYLAIKQV
ncbi:MAG: hypothetical protein ACI86X_001201 [Moritella sp.]|jgi:hypothetical protein